MTEQRVTVTIPAQTHEGAPDGEGGIIVSGDLWLTRGDIERLNATVTPVVPPEPRLPVWVDEQGVEWFHCGHHRQWERVDGVHIGGALRWPDLVARGGHLEGEEG